jgi:excisionase family DNA binding protein
MENLFLTGLTLPDLRSVIQKAVRDELQSALRDHRAPVDEWMNLDQLCAYLPSKPSKPTAYRWVSERTIPHHKKGKHLSFRKSEIDSWISEGRKATRQEITESV